MFHWSNIFQILHTSKQKPIHISNESISLKLKNDQIRNCWKATDDWNITMEHI